MTTLELREAREAAGLSMKKAAGNPGNDRRISS
jgi:hypothetical protein